MIVDKIKKINKEEESKKKNIKASDMLIGKWMKCDACKDIKRKYIKTTVCVLIVENILDYLQDVGLVK